MRIVHLIAGAGGMYCGSCLQGNTLVAALRRAGADVVLTPVYTPLRTDEAAEPGEAVVFGGVNVYLQQRSALFRHTPRFVDRLLDHPALLASAGRLAGSTRPERLGPLVVSMLRGQHGRQRKELSRLVAWLEGLRPDLVHLSNVMLSGMAPAIIQRLGIPVVCTLSGEDLFLEQVPEPHYGEARAELRRRSAELAALVAMNVYYADFMADYLQVPRTRIHVIPPGLNLDGHAAPSPAPSRPVRRSSDPCTIGYLARIAPEKGLHVLADAVARLAVDPQMPPLRLRAAGYLAPGDRPYLAGIERGLGTRFEYLGELDRASKIAMLQSLDVMSVPTVYRESKGLPVLEAWANGVPVVVPAHGTFPELLAETGGGLLCQPDDPVSLAQTLARLVSDPEWAAACGRRAQQVVHQRYHAAAMAQRTLELYRSLTERPV